MKPDAQIDTSRGFNSCEDGYQCWDNHNQLTEIPEPGDIVLYAFGNANGRADHTGIFCG
jgi:hypothetical protein